MCQGCFDAVKKYLPDMKWKDQESVLWNETAFPFCDAKLVAKQLRAFNKKRGFRSGGKK